MVYLLGWLLDFNFGHERFLAFANGIVVTRSTSDLRSISLDWSPFNSHGQSLPISKTPVGAAASGSGVMFLVKFCEDSPWEDTPRSCRSIQTNQTHAQLNDLRPSTKYLVNVEEAPSSATVAVNRSGRMLSAGPATANDQRPAEKDEITFLDKSKSIAIETQKYAVRNVDCKKGETDVTIETGEDFEGVISVQKPDGRPDSRCLIRGYGTPQRTYVLAINHSHCSMEFLENGTVMNAVILIQEHASLVLGSDRSLRISCNYQPAVIRLETGMGGQGSRIIQVGADPEVAAGSTLSPSHVRPPSSIITRRRLFTLQTTTQTFVQTTGRPLYRVPVAMAAVSGTDKTDKRPHTPEMMKGEAKIGRQTTEAFASFYAGHQQTQTSTISPLSAQQSQPHQETNGKLDFRLSAVSSGMAEDVTDVLGARGDGEEARERRNGSAVEESTGLLRHDNVRPQDVLMAMLSGANFNHSAETSTINETGKPRQTGISLAQVVAITATCSLAAIMVVSFLIWLIVFREVCSSRHRRTKGTKTSTEQLRFG
ncbi:hypothetical protein BV898_19204 [Hypsibius exemplaris]|uniref:Cuticlin N-terminal domain-containing protein n=1 Tax=Hypsibius exemplaris TaxID=2072580 RepID=A0A9X6NII5_HYPEX|nr:hypothetical protein BV898_19204 [Hypsibius exemplaris]